MFQFLSVTVSGCDAVSEQQVAADSCFTAEFIYHVHMWKTNSLNFTVLKDKSSSNSAMNSKILLSKHYRKKANKRNIYQS